MPRHTAHYASADPLQRRSAIAIARHHSGHPHPLRSGIGAVMSRLALVLMTAGLVQLLLHWFAR
jgi:hypothetical protein